MENNKKEILKKICYTELVYGRIKKKLGIELTNNEIEKYIYRILEETPAENIKIMTASTGRLFNSFICPFLKTVRQFCQKHFRKKAHRFIVKGRSIFIYNEQKIIFSFDRMLISLFLSSLEQNRN